MSISRFTALFVMIFLISPVACLAQSQFTAGMKESAASKNEDIVSVQELKMSDKGRKAFAKGAALLEKGDAAASLAYFDQAIAEFPGFYKAYYARGIAQFRLGHTIEAEQAFQISIDLTGGGYAPPEFGMGMVLCEKQELQQAETVIQRGLDLESGSAAGKYFLGLAQFGLNHLVEAERSLRQALLRRANFPPKLIFYSPKSTSGKTTRLRLWKICKRISSSTVTARAANKPELYLSKPSKPGTSRQAPRTRHTKNLQFTHLASPLIVR